MRQCRYALSASERTHTHPLLSPHGPLRFPHDVIPKSTLSNERRSSPFCVSFSGRIYIFVFFASSVQPRIHPFLPSSSFQVSTHFSLSLSKIDDSHTSHIPYPPRIHPHINPNLNLALHCSLSSVSIHRRFIIPSLPSSFLSKILLASCSPRHSPGCIYRFVLHRISPTSHFSHPTTPSLTSSLSLIYLIPFHPVYTSHLISKASSSSQLSPLTSPSSLHHPKQTTQTRKHKSLAQS